ncbi:MAG TPA: N-6 DNA methylase [Fimbriimonas sp.]|nr:N-6 DNA methylase [Fimbriimonas sp.]
MNFYREMLTYLGGHAANETIRSIYAFPTTVFSHSENLKAVIDGINKLDWHSVTMDSMGEIYEGLLSKNSQDSRSGAGQYFTPRPLVDCIVKLIQPGLGEVIQDPATGTGGFLISADQYIRTNVRAQEYNAKSPRYEGVEIEKGTYRICLMNAFLHRLESQIILGDALTKDAERLSPADVILANPPFGAKAGSARKQREDIYFGATNKQLAFLQHIYLSLKRGGRAAVILPDSVLFEDGVAKTIRQDLMNRCDLHTILRLPTGIFYSPGVKTNVLFFTRGHLDTDCTKTVWVYDMRYEAPKYGKKRPLQSKDFSHFESLFGDPTKIRQASIDQARWRPFTREEIADRSDNLNLSWHVDTEMESSEPEEIAEAILAHLRAALNEIEAVSDELAELPESNNG